MATIGQRKADHLALCAADDVGFKRASTLLECVQLVHDALPDMKLSDVDLSVSLFGKTLRAPIIILVRIRSCGHCIQLRTARRRCSPGGGGC